jgi:hypothetical protein
MTPQSDKQGVLKSLVAIARHTRRTPSRREFLASSGISETALFRFFPSWSAAVRAAGLKPNTGNQRLDDRQLLEDWGRAARKNHKIPSRRTYCHLGTFHHRTIARRFGRWSQVREAFRSFAQSKPEWADVLALLPPSAPKLAPKRQPPVAQALLPVRSSSRTKPPAPPQPSPSTQPSAKIRYPQLRGRPLYGQPIEFRGLRHEPVNEQGVVLLFGMVAKELGYIVESVQSGFPDCEAKRQIATERWQRVHLEFEFESRNFRDHGHLLTGCDVIVCWRHNWPDCPEHLEILELSSLIHSLPASNP